MGWILQAMWLTNFASCQWCVPFLVGVAVGVCCVGSVVLLSCTAGLVFLEHEIPGVTLGEGEMPGERMAMREVTLADEVSVDKWFEHESPQHQPQDDAVVEPGHEGYVSNACAQGNGKDVLESHTFDEFKSCCRCCRNGGGVGW